VHQQNVGFLADLILALADDNSPAVLPSPNSTIPNPLPGPTVASLDQRQDAAVANVMIMLYLFQWLDKGFGLLLVEAKATGSREWIRTYAPSLRPTGPEACSSLRCG